MALYRAAEHAASRGETSATAALAEQAAQAFSAVGEFDKASRCRLFAARAIANSGDLAGATDRVLAIVADADRRGLSARSLAALTDLGALQEQQGQLGEAMATHRQVLDTHRNNAHLVPRQGLPVHEMGLAVAAANVGRLLGRMAQAQQRPQAVEEARRLLQEARQLFGNNGRPQQAAQVLVVLCDLERQLGQPQRALLVLEDALALATTQAQPSLLAQVHLNRGLALRDLGDQPQCLAELKSALLAAQAGADPAMVLRCRQAVALAEADFYKPHELLKIFTLLAEEWQALGQHHQALPSLANRAAALGRLGEFNLAHLEWQRLHTALLAAAERQQAHEIRLALAELAWTRGDVALLETHLEALDHSGAHQRVSHAVLLLRAAIAAQSLDQPKAHQLLDLVAAGQPSRGIAFALAMQRLDLAVLRRDPGQLPSPADQVRNLASQAAQSPRERALVAQAEAEMLTWQGNLLLARQAMAVAHQAWSDLEEPGPTAASGLLAALLGSPSAPGISELSATAEILSSQGAPSRALAQQVGVAVLVGQPTQALHLAQQLRDSGRLASAATLAWLSGVRLNCDQLLVFADDILVSAGLPPAPRPPWPTT